MSLSPSVLLSCKSKPTQEGPRAPPPSFRAKWFQGEMHTQTWFSVCAGNLRPNFNRVNDGRSVVLGSRHNMWVLIDAGDSVWIMYVMIPGPHFCKEWSCKLPWVATQETKVRCVRQCFAYIGAVLQLACLEQTWQQLCRHCPPGIKYLCTGH